MTWVSETEKYLAGLWREFVAEKDPWLSLILGEVIDREERFLSEILETNWDDSALWGRQ